MIASRCGFVLPLLLLALTLTAAPGPASAGHKMALAPGDAAPTYLARLSDGRQFREMYARHRLTVVNFWATWCEPCKAEMPALQKLHEAHAESGLRVVGLMKDDVGLAVMQQFADDLGVTYTVAIPHEKSIPKWGGTSVLPVTFLIDQEGIVVRRYVGATEEQIRGVVEDIEALLEGRPLGTMVIPEKPAAVTDADRSRQPEKERQ